VRLLEISSTNELTFRLVYSFSKANSLQQLKIISSALADNKILCVAYYSDLSGALKS